MKKIENRGNLPNHLQVFAKKLTGIYKIGFCTTGLYSIVRKPNYLSEQSIWTLLYFFTVSCSKSRQLINSSLIGPVLLIALFQGSGWMTEKISIGKYPEYESVYCKRVGRYSPFLGLWNKVFGGEKKSS